MALSNLTTTDLAALRRIILTVIDDGDPECANVPWELYQSDFIDRDKANAQRLDFCDEIQRRITDEAARKVA